MAGYLYLQVIDLLRGLDSYSQMGYRLFGRASIFIFNATLAILIMGTITIYFVLVGSAASSLFISLMDNPQDGAFYTKDNFYIIIIAFLNLGTIYFKALKKMKGVSMLNFAAILLMTLFIVIYFAIKGTTMNPDKDNLS